MLIKEINSLAETNWQIELAIITITIVVTGLENDKDGKEEGKDAEEEDCKVQFNIQSRTAFYGAAR